VTASSRVGSQANDGTTDTSTRPRPRLPPRRQHDSRDGDRHDDDAHDHTHHAERPRPSRSRPRPRRSGPRPSRSRPRPRPKRTPTTPKRTTGTKPSPSNTSKASTSKKNGASTGRTTCERHQPPRPQPRRRRRPRQSRSPRRGTGPGRRGDRQERPDSAGQHEAVRGPSAARSPRCRATRSARRLIRWLIVRWLLVHELSGHRRVELVHFGLLRLVQLRLGLRRDHRQQDDDDDRLAQRVGHLERQGRPGRDRLDHRAERCRARGHVTAISPLGTNSSGVRDLRRDAHDDQTDSKVLRA